MKHGDTRRLANGALEIWDVDEDWWPEGLWIRVCLVCKGGPLNDSQVLCDEHKPLKRSRRSPAALLAAVVMAATLVAGAPSPAQANPPSGWSCYAQRHFHWSGVSTRDYLGHSNGVSVWRDAFGPWTGPIKAVHVRRNFFCDEQLRLLDLENPW